MTKNKKKKCDTPRKKKSDLRHTLTSISIGNKDKALLLYLKNNQKKRFNIKEYHRISKLPRSSVYRILERLINNGLVKKPYPYNHTITKNGITTLEILKGSVAEPRRECRKNDLSTHYLRYTLPISDKSNFNEKRIDELNPLRWQQLNLRNLKQYYIYFEDGTIIIGPKQISIRIHDIIAKDTDEAHFKAFNKAIGYMDKISEIGLKTEGIELEQSHYERIDSYLAEALEKIDKRYFLDLGNGKKFWIDYSKDKRNDETNEEEIRNRVDQFMEDMINSDVLLSDIDKIVKALGFISKIECVRFKREIKQLNGITPNEKPNYFG